MQLYEYIGWKFAIFNVYRLSGIKAGRISPVLIPLNLVWDGDLVKQVRTQPVRPADGVVGRGISLSSRGKIVVSWGCGRR